MDDKIYVNAIKITLCNNEQNPEGLKDKYLNRKISAHLDKLGFKEMRGRDNTASFFKLKKEDFDEIVIPICPELSIISTLPTLSTQKHIKCNNNGVDGVVIGVDESKDGVVISGENGDNVDKNKEKENKFDYSKTKPEVIKI